MTHSLHRSTAPPLHRSTPRQLILVLTRLRHSSVHYCPCLLQDAKLYVSDYQMDVEHAAEIATAGRIFFIVADSREALIGWIMAIGTSRSHAYSGYRFPHHLITSSPHHLCVVTNERTGQVPTVTLKSPKPLAGMTGCNIVLGKHGMCETTASIGLASVCLTCLAVLWWWCGLISGFLQKRGQWNVSWQIRFFRTSSTCILVVCVSCGVVCRLIAVLLCVLLPTNQPPVKDGKHVLEYYDYLEEHKLRGLIMITGSEITDQKEETDLRIKTKEREYILRVRVLCLSFSCRARLVLTDGV